MTTSLTFDHLDRAVADGAAALRTRARLQPAGGPNDKVFPPTFGDTVRIRDQDGEVRSTKYAAEWRRVDGEDRLCVLVDSVASQANRFEEALLRAYDEARLAMPMVRVDFTGATHEEIELDLSTLGGNGYITTLEAPHRLADALLRDSMLDGVRFRASELGRAFSAAGPHSASAVFELCPAALVFGMWDSTGPKGGQGAKFQRALVSEIVGVNVRFGRKTASRIDPAGIELQAGPVYQAKDPEEEWTVRPEEAAHKSKKPVLFSRSGGKAGKPSSINHGNITPTVDSDAGGVTLDYAEQTTVLSFPALRRLRFPQGLNGARWEGEARAQAEHAARVMLAALAALAIALQRDEGYDLRSRCAFVPEGPLALEIVGRDGEVTGPLSLGAADALRIVEEAMAKVKAAGFAWNSDPIDLLPADKLVDLIRRSREVAATGVDAEA